MIYIIFGIFSSSIVIGLLIYNIEILPTVIKKRGEKKDDKTSSDKAVRRNVEEYYEICKELNKPLFFYYYMKWLDKHTRHMIYIWVFVVFFSMTIAIF